MIGRRADRVKALVGKLYNLLAHRIASRLADAEADHTAVGLLAAIGEPVDSPLAIDITTSASRDAVADVVDKELGDMSGLTDALVRGQVDVF